MPPPIAFKFSLPIGDFWYASAGIKHVCGLLKAQADIYFGLDVQMKFLDGTRAGLTRKTYEMAKPLIEAQEWCNSVQEYTGQRVDRDLDQTQLNPAINNPVMPYNHLGRWYGQMWPDMECDLSEPWISVTRSGFNMDRNILINRTDRYRNENIDYSILKPWEDRTFFVGLENEYARFNQETGLNITYLRIDDFLSLASAISVCRVFIGNQSMCFGIAEAMKSPRILEVCHFAPNVIPHGSNGYDFVWQHGLDFLVKKFMR